MKFEDYPVHIRPIPINEDGGYTEEYVIAEDPENTRSM